VLEVVSSCSLSCEAKHIAASVYACQEIWLRNLIKKETAIKAWTYRDQQWQQVHDRTCEEPSSTWKEKTNQAK